MSFWSQKTAAIGQKKYGLVKKQGSALQPQSAAVAAMFGGGDDDDAPRDAKQEVAAQMRDLGAAQRRRAAQQAAQAASVDPSIYDYDGVYDKISTATRSASSPPPTKNSSKNLGSGTPRIGAWTKLTNRDPPRRSRLGFYSNACTCRGLSEDSQFFYILQRTCLCPSHFGATTAFQILTFLVDRELHSTFYLSRG